MNATDGSDRCEGSSKRKSSTPTPTRPAAPTAPIVTIPPIAKRQRSSDQHQDEQQPARARVRADSDNRQSTYTPSLALLAQTTIDRETVAAVAAATPFGSTNVVAGARPGAGAVPDELSPPPPLSSSMADKEHPDNTSASTSTNTSTPTVATATATTTSTTPGTPIPTKKGATPLPTSERQAKRNAREKVRCMKISQQINNLHGLLTDVGAPVGKNTKGAVLSAAAEYIRSVVEKDTNSANCGDGGGGGDRVGDCASPLANVQSRPEQHLPTGLSALSTYSPSVSTIPSLTPILPATTPTLPLASFVPTSVTQATQTGMLIAPLSHPSRTTTTTTTATTTTTTKPSGPTLTPAPVLPVPATTRGTGTGTAVASLGKTDESQQIPIQSTTSPMDGVVTVGAPTIQGPVRVSTVPHAPPFMFATAPLLRGPIQSHPHPRPQPQPQSQTTLTVSPTLVSGSTTTSTPTTTQTSASPIVVWSPNMIVMSDLVRESVYRDVFDSCPVGLVRTVRIVCVVRIRCGCCMTTHYSIIPIPCLHQTAYFHTHTRTYSHPPVYS